MSDSVRFLFENAFDDGATGGAGNKKAPVFTESQLADAREEAYAQGHAAGLEESRAQIEHAVAVALSRIGDELAQRTAWQREQHGEAVQLALEIGRKLASALLSRQPLTEIEALIEECLSEIANEAKIAIRVREHLVDPLKARIDEVAERGGFAGRIVLLADESFDESDCRVEWADGGAERRTAIVDGAIERSIQQYLNAGGQPLERAAAPCSAEPSDSGAEEPDGADGSDNRPFSNQASEPRPLDAPGEATPTDLEPAAD